MLSIPETMDSILRYLERVSKAHEDVYEVSRFHDLVTGEARLVLVASCFEHSQATLGQLLVRHIKRMGRKNAPDSVFYTLNGRQYDTFCDATVVLVICEWRPKTHR